MISSNVLAGRWCRWFTVFRYLRPNVNLEGQLLYTDGNFICFIEVMLIGRLMSMIWPDYYRRRCLAHYSVNQWRHYCSTPMPTSPGWVPHHTMNQISLLLVSRCADAEYLKSTLCWSKIVNHFAYVHWISASKMSSVCSKADNFNLAGNIYIWERRGWWIRVHAYQWYQSDNSQCMPNSVQCRRLKSGMRDDQSELTYIYSPVKLIVSMYFRTGNPSQTETMPLTENRPR